MGKLEDCLIKAGISKTHFEELYAQAKDLDLDFDDIRASSFLDEAEKQVVERARELKINSIRKHQAIAAMDNHVTKYDAERLTGIITKTRDDSGRMVGLEFQQEAIVGKYYGHFAKALDKYKPQFIGTMRSKLAHSNFVHELFGKATGDVDAQNFAKMFKNIAEEMRLRVNRAGGSIRYLENWALPQSHDALKIDRMGKQVWANATADLVDIQKMGFRDKDELVKFLEDKVFDKIIQKNDSIYEPMVISGKKAKQRFLHFSDSDSWLKYQESFGSNDIWGSVLNHFDTMSRDIAVMERFGPDYDKTFSSLLSHFKKTTTLGKDKASSTVNRTQAMYDQFLGRNVPVNRAVAEYGSSIRNVITSGLLHKTLLTAFSDIPYSEVTAIFNGVKPFKVATRMLKGLSVDRKADRELAAQLGLAWDYCIDSLQAANRYADATGGHKITRNMAALTTKASFLEGWTNASRRAFALEFSGSIARGLKSGLNKRTIKAMERYGITEADHPALLKGITTSRGASYVDVTKITDNDLATKFAGMVRSERSYATPGGGLRASTALLGGTKAGTGAGEVVRSIGQFKNFPVSIWNTHIMRALRSQDLTGGQRASYIGITMAGTAAMGHISNSAYQIAKGESPDFKINAQNMWRGLMKGGSLGLMGDLLEPFTDDKSYGTVSSRMAGPTLSEFDKLMKIGQSGTSGEFGTAWSKSVDFMKTKTPGTWYTDIVVDRLFWDGLKYLGDPDYDMKQLRKEARIMAEDREQLVGSIY